MIRRAAAGLGAALVLAAAPAAARTVNYEQTETEFQEAAVAIGAPTPAPAPARGPHEVVVDGLQRLDHRLQVLGISCSAWQVDNPLSNMVRRALSGWDADGMLEPVASRPLLRVTVEQAGSDIRCVELREMDAPCIVRTRISGQMTLEALDGEPRTAPFAIEDRQVHHSPGVCGSLSRGAGLSGRAASFALIEELAALADGAR